MPDELKTSGNSYVNVDATIQRGRLLFHQWSVQPIIALNP